MESGARRALDGPTSCTSSVRSAGASGCEPILPVVTSVGPPTAVASASLPSSPSEGSVREVLFSNVRILPTHFYFLYFGNVNDLPLCGFTLRFLQRQLRSQRSRHNGTGSSQPLGIGRGGEMPDVDYVAVLSDWRTDYASSGQNIIAIPSPSKASDPDLGEFFSAASTHPQVRSIVQLIQSQQEQVPIIVGESRPELRYLSEPGFVVFGPRADVAQRWSCKSAQYRLIGPHLALPLPEYEVLVDCTTDQLMHRVNELTTTRWAHGVFIEIEAGVLPEYNTAIAAAASHASGGGGSVVGATGLPPQTPDPPLWPDGVAPMPSVSPPPSAANALMMRPPSMGNMAAVASTHATSRQPGECHALEPPLVPSEGPASRSRPVGTNLGQVGDTVAQCGTSDATSAVAVAPAKNVTGVRVVLSQFMAHKTDPSCLGVVASPNDVFIGGIVDMIIEKGHLYKGAVFPTSMPWRLRRRVTEMTRKVGSFLGSQGYRGIFACNFMVDDADQLWFVRLLTRKPRYMPYLCCALEQLMPRHAPSLMELECAAVTAGQLPYNTVEVDPGLAEKSMVFATYKFLAKQDVRTVNAVRPLPIRTLFKKVHYGPLPALHAVLCFVGPGCTVKEGALVAIVCAVGRSRNAVGSQLVAGLLEAMGLVVEEDQNDLMPEDVAGVMLMVRRRGNRSGGRGHAGFAGADSVAPGSVWHLAQRGASSVPQPPSGMGHVEVPPGKADVDGRGGQSRLSAGASSMTAPAAVVPSESSDAVVQPIGCAAGPASAAIPSAGAETTVREDSHSPCEGDTLSRSPDHLTAALQSLANDETPHHSGSVGSGTAAACTTARPPLHPLRAGTGDAVAPCAPRMSPLLCESAGGKASALVTPSVAAVSGPSGTVRAGDAAAAAASTSASTLTPSAVPVKQSATSSAQPAPARVGPRSPSQQLSSATADSLGTPAHHSTQLQPRSPALDAAGSSNADPLAWARARWQGGDSVHCLPAPPLVSGLLPAPPPAQSARSGAVPGFRDGDGPGNASTGGIVSGLAVEGRDRVGATSGRVGSGMVGDAGFAKSGDAGVVPDTAMPRVASHRFGRHGSRQGMPRTASNVSHLSGAGHAVLAGGGVGASDSGGSTDSDDEESSDSESDSDRARRDGGGRSGHARGSAASLRRGSSSTSLRRHRREAGSGPPPAPVGPAPPTHAPPARPSAWQMDEEPGRLETTPDHPLPRGPSMVRDGRTTVDEYVRMANQGGWEDPVTSSEVGHAADVTPARLIARAQALVPLPPPIAALWTAAATPGAPPPVVMPATAAAAIHGKASNAGECSGSADKPAAAGPGGLRIPATAPPQAPLRRAASVAKSPAPHDVPRTVSEQSLSTEEPVPRLGGEVAMAIPAPVQGDDLPRGWAMPHDEAVQLRGSGPSTDSWGPLLRGSDRDAGSSAGIPGAVAGADSAGQLSSHGVADNPGSSGDVEARRRRVVVGSSGPCRGESVTGEAGDPGIDMHASHRDSDREGDEDGLSGEASRDDEGPCVHFAEGAGQEGDTSGEHTEVEAGATTDHPRGGDSTMPHAAPGTSALSSSGRRLVREEDSGFDWAQAPPPRWDGALSPDAIATLQGSWTPEGVAGVRATPVGLCAGGTVVQLQNVPGAAPEGSATADGAFLDGTPILVLPGGGGVGVLSELPSSMPGEDEDHGPLLVVPRSFASPGSGAMEAEGLGSREPACDVAATAASAVH